MSSTKNCPFCSSTNLEEVKDYSKGFGAFAMRFYHDRKCKDCEAIWTPPTPRWGGWACVLTGSTLMVGLASFCILAVSDEWRLISKEPSKVIHVLGELPNFPAIAGIVLTIGFSCVFFGVRAFFSSRDPKIQSQPLKSTPANPLPEYRELLFIEEVSNEHQGRPVGLHTLGVMVYAVAGRSSEIEIIPYADIDQIKIEQETRGQRIWSTFWMTLGLLAFGIIGSLMFYNMFFGSAPKLPSELPFLGIIAIFGWAFLGPIALLIAPFGITMCFTRLGVYLSFVSKRRNGKFYFEPSAWDETGCKVVEFLRQHKPEVILPS